MPLIVTRKNHKKKMIIEDLIFEQLASGHPVVTLTTRHPQS